MRVGVRTYVCGGHDDGVLEGEMRVGTGEREGRAYCLQTSTLVVEGQIYHVQRGQICGSTQCSQWSALTATCSGLGTLLRGIRTGPCWRADERGGLLCQRWECFSRLHASHRT